MPLDKIDRSPIYFLIAAVIQSLAAIWSFGKLHPGSIDFFISPYYTVFVFAFIIAFLQDLFKTYYRK